jgi:hypothetical protein
MKRFLLPVALVAAVLVIFFVPTLQAQKLKNGNISSLKGLTKVFIADASGSRAWPITFKPMRKVSLLLIACRMRSFR